MIIGNEHWEVIATTEKERRIQYASIYPYHRIARLAMSLARSKVPPRTMDEILKGGETIARQKDKGEATAWFREAMRRMDQLLDADACRKIREACACCTGGRRHEIAKQIFAQNETLEDRVNALNAQRYIVGHSAELLDDGRIRVRFAEKAGEGAYCPCLAVSDEKMPISYCYCCGGHIKHHVQTALGVKTSCTTVSTLLSSGGKLPCVFAFDIKEKP